jgi:hypothetical protein
MAKKIKWISNEAWSQYATCLLMHMILPLLPLVLEGIVSEVKPSTFAITAAMYAMGIGLSSKNVAQFALCIVIGIIFSCVFGHSSGGNADGAVITATSIGSMLLVFVIHSIERYNRHVVDCIPFFEFAKGEQA